MPWDRCTVPRLTESLWKHVGIPELEEHDTNLPRGTAQVLFASGLTFLVAGPFLAALGCSVLGAMPDVSESGRALQGQTALGDLGPVAVNIGERIAQIQVVGTVAIIYGVASTAAGLTLALVLGRAAWGTLPSSNR